MMKYGGPLDPSIVVPKVYEKDKMKTSSVVPVERGRETHYAFEWMFFKPRTATVAPFEATQSRLTNRERTQ